MQTNSCQFVIDFIEEIWNNRNFNMLDEFIHPDFQDHSLPQPFTGDKEGMKNWILEAGSSFEHRTIIEDQVTEGAKVILKIRMEMRHVGSWRNIEPTGMEVSAAGYRFFKLSEGRIIGHWGLIDGQSLENQLKNASHGCRLAG